MSEKITAKEYRDMQKRPIKSKYNARKTVLDPCCGSRMFWFDHQDERVVFADNRSLNTELCDGRSLVIDPDALADFRDMPYEDEMFNVVVFDPPHLVKAGRKSWLALKYGVLGNDWKQDIRAGFVECFRVLKTGGVLIFKWNETQITTREILQLTDAKPLFGHISGKRANTHWITFMKDR